MSERMLWWIGWPLLVLGIYFGLTYLAHKAAFHPASYPDGLWETQSRWNAEDVWLETSDGVKIHGWMIPSATPGALITLYLHGNAGNLTHRVDHIEAMSKAGMPLLIIDYPGYGKSEGSASEQGCNRAADAAYEHLTAEGFGPHEIVLYGESLGTAMAVDLASRKPCAGVVLEAPFRSARAVAARVLPWIGPLVVSGLDTGAKIAKVKAPLLILHGTLDRVIAYDLGREVFDLANEPKQFWTVEGARHSDIVIREGPRYVRRLREFYAGLTLGAHGKPLRER